ncbi:hypothetical protein H0H87_000943 [Tephrocybe sp. NHM501043]|nr:hypothetical protein H0H87_000943 [Tephrocybe sp. NHM501043]
MTSFPITAETLNGARNMLVTLLTAIDAVAPQAPCETYTEPLPPSEIPPTPDFIPHSPIQSHTTPSALLCRMFPEVEEEDLEAVITHEFRAADLYKLDPKQRFNDPVHHIRNWDTHEVEPNRYPTENSLYIPLCTYFAILSTHIQESDQLQMNPSLFFEYLGHLFSMAGKYNWERVVAYHRAFFDMRQWDMKDGDYTQWGIVDAELTEKYLCGHEPKPEPHADAENLNVLQPTTNQIPQGRHRKRKSLPATMSSLGDGSPKKSRERKRTRHSDQQLYLLSPTYLGS